MDKKEAVFSNQRFTDKLSKAILIVAASVFFVILHYLLKGTYFKEVNKYIESVSSNYNDSEARQAVDSDPKSRWTSNQPQRPGMSFRVALDKVRWIERLRLDSGPNPPGDYLRSFIVKVSLDNRNWHQVAGDKPTSTQFDIPIRAYACYIDIINMGQHPILYWSLHELIIYQYGLQWQKIWLLLPAALLIIGVIYRDGRKGGLEAIEADLFLVSILSFAAILYFQGFSWQKELNSQNINSVSSNYNPSEAKNAIDEDLKTRWTSNIPQRSGVFFLLELDKVRPIKKLVLDSGPNAVGDYPREYKAEVSIDGHNWQLVDRRKPSRLEVTVQIGEQTRFIKITCLGTHPFQYWSIHEIKIYQNQFQPLSAGLLILSVTLSLLILYRHPAWIKWRDESPRIIYPVEGHKERNPRFTTIMVLLAYSLLTIVMTYPLAFKLSEAIVGGGGDTLQDLWNFWWVKKAVVELHKSFYDCDYVYYPAGVNLAFHTLSLFNAFLAIPLQGILSRVTIYNLLILFSYLCAGWGTYLLVRYLTKNSLAAFIGGLVFAFSPYHAIHSRYGQLNLAAIEFIPWYILYLIQLKDKPGIKNSLLAALFLLLASLCSWYYSVYLVLFTILFIAYHLVFQKSSILNISFLKAFSLMVLAFALGVIPFALPLIQEYLTSPYPVLDTYERLSNDLFSFIFPFFQHPILAPPILSVYRKFTVDPYFLGYVPLLLSLSAIKNERIEKTRFWILSLLIFLILSLGPYLRILGVVYKEYPLPHQILQTLPPFNVARSPNRYTLMAYISLAILVGYASCHIFCWIDRSSMGEKSEEGNVGNIKLYLKGLVAAIIACLILFEYLNLPFDPAPNINSVPAFYKEIAPDKGDYAIAEIPLVDNAHINSLYMYFQTFHNKKILRAYLSRTSPDWEKYLREVPILRLLGQPGLLAPMSSRQRTEFLVKSRPDLIKFRIRFIIVHKNYGHLSEDDHKLLSDFLNRGFTALSYQKDMMDIYRVY